MRRALVVVSTILAAGGAARAAQPAPVSDLAALAREALAQAGSLRGIEPSGPVRTALASRDAVERYVDRQARLPENRVQLALAARFFVALGALAPTVSLVDAFVAFARDQVAGYYDWEQKTLFVADWLPASLQRPTLVHEAAHALQDQRFHIGRFTRPAPGCSEPFAAIAALLEGDATTVMIDALAGGRPDAETDRDIASALGRLETLMRLMAWSPGVPSVLRESLLFPYVAGTPLVLDVRSRGGWKAVDALYDHPPLSTEQVLHPERLGGPDAGVPREVSLPALAPVAGRGWSARGTDIAGELGIRLALEASLDRAKARQAAAGWGGDRFVSLAGPPGDLLAWATSWDTPADAAEFHAALGTLPHPPDAVERRGDRVAAAWGDARAARAVTTAMLAGMRVSRVKDLDGWVRLAARAAKINGPRAGSPSSP